MASLGKGSKTGNILYVIQIYEGAIRKHLGGLANLWRPGCFQAEPDSLKDWPDSCADGPGKGGILKTAGGRFNIIQCHSEVCTHRRLRRFHHAPNPPDATAMDPKMKVPGSGTEIIAE